MGIQNRQDLLELSRWRIARIGRRDIMSIAEGEMSRAQLADCPMKFRLAVTKWAAVDSNHVPPRYQHGALPVELAAQGSRPALYDFEPEAVDLEFTGSAVTKASSPGRHRRQAVLSGYCRR
jgi:hypothetical protein